MADDNKKPPAPKPPAGFFENLDPVETVIVLLVIASLAGVLVSRLGNFDPGEASFFGVPLEGLALWFRGWSGTFKFISFFLSGIFFAAAVTFSQMAGQVAAAEKAKLYPNGEPQISNGPVEESNPIKDKWKEILERSTSENQSDWRLAIIEADIILAELLEKLELPGDTIGDKLKAVEKSDFLTLDYAWEAHKARNAIAHEGSDYLLNQKETRRVISLYEAVFKEFYLI